MLSDEDLRNNYDKGGKDGVEGAPQADSATLFAMIFGSEKFESLVGELKLASQMQAKEGETHSFQLDNFKQRKREIQCALNLALKLQPYIDSGENEEVREEPMLLSMIATIISIQLYFVFLLSSYFIYLFVFTCAHCQAFKISLEEEVKELSSSPFGSTLVATIGHAYYEHATSELSSFDSFAVGIHQATRRLQIIYLYI